MTTLISLSLNNNAFGYQGIATISNTMKTNASLMALNLSNNKIESDGAIAIADALKVNATLLSLKLDFQDIDDNRADFAIADALRVNISLIDLNFYTKRIGIQGVTAIAEALRCNPSLTVLQMNYAYPLEDILSFKVDTEVSQSRLLKKLIGEDGGNFLANKFRMKFSALTTLVR